MQNVTIDREKYIGGSDIPIIMGLSKFKSRWNLLQEKAGFSVGEFSGNKFTEYGNKMEGVVRNYLNKIYSTEFLENKTIVGDLRYHSDGIDDERVVEIKTTSRKFEGDEGYKDYLVQLLFGMHLNQKSKGLLAIYNRPEDFSRILDPKRLFVREINIKDFEGVISEILLEVDSFRKDLARLKENPFLLDVDFKPPKIKELSKELSILELKMEEFKGLEARYKEVKEELLSEMMKNEIKTYSLANGGKVTRVDKGPDSKKIVVNEERLKKEYPEIYQKVAEEKTKRGRSGYLKISFQK